MRRPSTPLSSRIVSVDFRGTPLKEVLVQLGASVGAKVVIHQEELEIEGVKLSTPIYLRLYDVDLQTAFDRLNLGHPASCILDQRGIELHVTTVQSLPSVVRIYDVHDLIDRWVVAPFMQQTHCAGSFIALFGGGTTTPPPREELMDALIRVITDTTDRDSVFFSQGSELIQAVGSRIVVSGRRPLHRKIEELLRRLREIAL